MSETQQLVGGELNAALTREVVRIHAANLGRGPRKSFSFYNDNVVVTVMQEVMTRAEQRLTANGDGHAVRTIRQLLQQVMDGELRASVEALTGRKVIASMSDTHLDPDMAVGVFVLDGPVHA
ncbi:MAG TPA: Na-translocating system protein MpsC family protein [Conexibacter sp.]|nr:Na-translocating system protein MpsC family protein [Conexibacter sp.]